jgi:hypothetical protein
MIFSLLFTVLLWNWWFDEGCVAYVGIVEKKASKRNDVALSLCDPKADHVMCVSQQTPAKAYNFGGCLYILR